VGILMEVDKMGMYDDVRFKTNCPIEDYEMTWHKRGEPTKGGR